ncbi:hypothetical protein L2E82_45650 [Cichorium intybus]|uniref:Uncharacterized protein n=1 Tax=Cichorium intybus TaxID=13427 RepID=A0ACB8ZTN8_CICIN|nr:hypothetical protein L2E82_45650 [Cichorium intybus]
MLVAGGDSVDDRDVDSGRLAHRFPNLLDVDIVQACIVSPRDSGICLSNKFVSIHVSSFVSDSISIWKPDFLGPNLIDRGVQILAQGCPNLRRLVLLGATNDGLVSIANECFGAVYLRFTSTKAILRRTFSRVADPSPTTTFDCEAEKRSSSSTEGGYDAASSSSSHSGVCDWYVTIAYTQFQLQMVQDVFGLVKMDFLSTPALSAVVRERVGVDVDISAIGVSSFSGPDGQFDVDVFYCASDYVKLMKSIFDFQSIKKLIACPQFSFWYVRKKLEVHLYAFMVQFSWLCSEDQSYLVGFCAEKTIQAPVLARFNRRRQNLRFLKRQFCGNLHVGRGTFEFE